MAETVRDLVQDHFDCQISKIKEDLDIMMKNIENKTIN
jgi:hypothetical protein